MHDWITIELVLGVLLVTTFTSVGLLALWAATSPRHWFVRVAVVLAVLSPLLLVPAYELLVLFVVQTVLIATGISVYELLRRKRARRWTETPPEPADAGPAVKFSLSSLLLLTFLIAAAVTVGARLPRLNFYAWGSIGLNSLASGLAALLGAWMYTTRRRWISWPTALIVSVAAGVALALFDWFFLSFVSIWIGWPPDSSNMFFRTGVDDRPVIAWIFITTSVTLITSLILFLFAASGANRRFCPSIDDGRSSRIRRSVARATLALLLFSVLAFPVFVLGELLFPDPIPEVAIPTPNAYGKFIAAGKIAAASQFEGTIDFDVATAQQIAAEVAKCTELYAIVEGALGKPTVVPVNYSYSADQMPMDHLMSFRAIARALYGKAKVAELDGRYDDAGEAACQAIAFGYAVRPGGLLIDALVGIGCSNYGMRPLFQVREKLSDEELKRSIALLTRLVASEESYDEVWQRDRVWTQRAGGWHSHLVQLLGEIVDHTYDLIFITSDANSNYYRAQQATACLLVVELALARYRQHNDGWPVSLDKLVPHYLETVPKDPLDSDLNPLRYSQSEQTYVLYSVGYDGDDDGGRPPEKDSLGSGDWTGDGDLRLDVYFAPADQPAGTTPAASLEPTDVGAEDAVPSSHLP